MQRHATLADVIHQWLMTFFMGGVVALIYLQLLPRIDRIEPTLERLEDVIIQGSEDTRQFISDQTREAVQQQQKEPIPWENLTPELKKHTTPASGNR